MNILFIVLFTIGQIVALILFFIWLNRGSSKVKDLVFYIGYSMLLSTIITVTIWSEEKPSAFIYFPVMAVIVGVLLVPEIVDAIKGRQHPVPVLVIVAGVTCSIIVPYLHYVWLMLLFSGLGIVIQACYFKYLRRYPFLNSMWLENALKKSVDKVSRGCSYTTKPVVIDGAFEKRWVSRTLFGCSILIKKDKAIIRMTKKLHNKLGKPNMKELGKELVSLIKEKITR
jgi:hypothetical protein